MVKIAFYVESMIIGGAERALIDLVNQLDPIKFDITVISIFSHSVYDGYQFQFTDFFPSYVHYKTLVDNSNAFRYNLFNRAYAHMNRRVLYSFFIKEKYDVEIAFYEGFPTEFVAHSTNSHSRKIAWLHTDSVRLYKGLTDKEIDQIKKRYGHFDKIIGVSNSVCYSFSTFFPEITAQTVYNLIDIPKIQEMANEKPSIQLRNPFFLTVGRFTPVKGYDRLLSVLGKLYRDGYTFHLMMVGDGDQKTELEALIHKEKLDEVVSLLGMQTNPYSFMKRADYLICSSYAEGWGLASEEAIVCGTPVLSVECGGIHEIFGNKECGIICSNSEKGLYDMLKYALNHPEKREEYHIACLERNSEAFLKERIRLVEDALLGNRL